MVPDSLNRPWVESSFDRAQERLERDGRDVFESRHEVIKALDLKPGQTVADIGSGSGFMVDLMADAVGPRGKVYAVDIAKNLLAGVKARAEEAGKTQIETVLSTERDTNLPEDELDLVFSSDTYHHFAYPQDTLQSIRRALRPGGRWVVIDFIRDPKRSADWVLEHVRADKRTVIREIQAAGFQFVRERDIPGLTDSYFIEFESPS